jgi:hypothetical protein
MHLARSLGGELWNVLADSTRAALVWAECLWRFCEERRADDFGAIGTEYRKALEGEYNRHVRPLVAPIMNARQEADSLGNVLRVLSEGSGMLRGVFEAKLGRQHKLLDPGLLGGARDIWRELNSAAHSGGLTRERCLRLRHQMIADGMLGRLLRALTAGYE